MERVTGIEPAYPAWKASGIPSRLSVKMAVDLRISVCDLGRCGPQWAPLYRPHGPAKDALVGISVVVPLEIVAQVRRKVEGLHGRAHDLHTVAECVGEKGQAATSRCFGMGFDGPSHAAAESQRAVAGRGVMPLAVDAPAAKNRKVILVSGRR
jgi:hypothetical protein